MIKLKQEMHEWFTFKLNVQTKSHAIKINGIKKTNMQ